MFGFGRAGSRPLHAVSMLQLNNSVEQQSLSVGLFSALLSLGLDVNAIERAIGTPLTAVSIPCNFCLLLFT